VSWQTVKRLLKRLGYSYRRARRVCAQAPRPPAVAAAQKALQRLRQLAGEGVCDLVYGDESGFSLQPLLPYLWQPKGQTLGFATQCHRQRLNVLGFWKCAGAEAARLLWHSRLGSWKAQDFIAAVETKLLPRLRRRTILVLDNASLHRSVQVRQQRAAWRRRGLRLLFLPPYCPHLNLIEVLWKQLKYRWLEPAAYTDFESLCQSVQHILKSCPKRYPITFG
jgi:transposase